MQKLLEFLRAVDKVFLDNDEWRYGQACFNVLHALHPKLADGIRGSAVDPFYTDDRVPVFLVWVKVALEQKDLK